MQKTTQGAILIGVALFMLMGFFNASLASPMVALMAFLIAIALPGGIGSYLLYSGLQSKSALSNQKAALGRRTLEAEILSFARQHRGQLTVIEVVSHFALDKAQAESVLDSLAQQGYADYEITDSGLLVYTFHELQRLGDKTQSRRIEDA